jgi:hypothetical protein
MDCYFNRFIPKSQSDTIVVRPAGKTFINGMCESYSTEDYDNDIVSPYMTISEYNKVIDHINQALFNDYPCPGCQLFAYLCCPCTVGISCIIPWLQVNTARRSLEKELIRIN